jgi:hypothetical protein
LHCVGHFPRRSRIDRLAFTVVATVVATVITTAAVAVVAAIVAARLLVVRAHLGTDVAMSRGFVARPLIGLRVAALGSQLTTMWSVVVRALRALIVRPIGLVIVSLTEITCRRMGLVAGRAGADDATAGKIARPLRGGDRRTAVVIGIPERAVVTSFPFMMHLLDGALEMPIVLRLLAGGPSVDALGTAVVADPVDLDIADDRSVHINVADDMDVDVGDSAVVGEVSAAPFAADEAYAKVAKAVVNPAVEADTRSPVAGMPDVHAAAKPPVTGSPKQARLRSEDPGARNPVVVARPPGPIARRPDIVGPGANGLGIDWQRRWPYPYGNADCDLC